MESQLCIPTLNSVNSTRYILSIHCEQGITLCLALYDQQRYLRSTPTFKKLIDKHRIKRVGQYYNKYSVHFSHFSTLQLCLTLCNPMDCSMPGFSVHHQLPELAQTLVHWVSDAIQPSHPLLSPSPPAFNLSQHQGLF